MHILVVKSSLSGENSISSKLVDHLLKNNHSQHQITVRDLSSGLSVPDQHYLTGRHKPAEQRTEAEKASSKLADELIEEMKAADLLVITAPMYNFSVPANLKIWIDYVAQFGKTFTFENGAPKGLLTKKKAIVINTLGGNWVDTKADFLTNYVPFFLAFLGIEEQKVVIAQGSASDAEAALREGKKKIEQLEEWVR